MCDMTTNPGYTGRREQGEMTLVEAMRVLRDRSRAGKFDGDPELQAAVRIAINAPIVLDDYCSCPPQPSGSGDFSQIGLTFSQWFW